MDFGLDQRVAKGSKGDAHQAVSGNRASDLEEGEACLDLAVLVHEGQVVPFMCGKAVSRARFQPERWQTQP